MPIHTTGGATGGAQGATTSTVVAPGQDEKPNEIKDVAAVAAVAAVAGAEGDEGQDAKDIASTGFLTATVDVAFDTS